MEPAQDIEELFEWPGYEIDPETLLYTLNYAEYIVIGPGSRQKKRLPDMDQRKEKQEGCCVKPGAVQFMG